MRYLVAALLMAVGLAGLVVYAAADDSYYEDGTSRWDHAARAGTAPILVGAAVAAAAVTLWSLTRTRAENAPPSPALIAAAMVYSFSLFVAFTFLSIGH
jgi:hypothetical protein